MRLFWHKGKVLTKYDLRNLKHMEAMAGVRGGCGRLSAIPAGPVLAWNNEVKGGKGAPRT